MRLYIHRLTKLLAACITLSLTLTYPLHAAELGDRADKPGVEQNAIIPNELIPPAPPLSAEQALKTFKLPPGLRIETVASDPLVASPVAMSIGPDGRLWVVEMHGYMPNLDGIGEDQPVGIVATLEDTDGDGVMDKRTVFLDQLVMPRAILVTSNGVLIGAPPMLWFCRDTDGDGKCDEKVEVANDFGIQVDPKRPEISNPQRAPNGLLWSIDNWVYAAAYTKRFRYIDGKWISTPTTFRGQWGLSENAHGQLIYNSNADQLRADILHSSYLGRNPFLSPMEGANVNLAKDQLVWPSRVNPGINRGYQPAMLNNHKLKIFTAACGPWVYRGNLLGQEYDGNAFVCEPAGNFVRRNLLDQQHGSFTATNAHHQDEFLTSTDERFRPVNLYTGPDGALYVVDFYRGVLEHRISLTSYLRKQSESRNLQTPINQGRIYRIVPENHQAKANPNLLQQTTQDHLNALAHPNSWWRMTAQQLLIERNDPNAIDPLRKLVSDSPSPLARLHALWTLEGLGRLEIQQAILALKDPDAKVRAAAVRLCESFFITPSREAATQALANLPHDSDPFVQQQLILSLSQAAIPELDLKIADIIAASPDTHYLTDAAVSGLLGREETLLRQLLTQNQWQQPQPHLAKFISRLTQSAFASSNTDSAQNLLNLLLDQPPSSPQANAMLNGMLATAPSTSKKPIKLLQSPNLPNSTTYQKLLTLLTWPDKPGVKPEPPLKPLTPTQQAHFDLGKSLYTGICAPCHQPHGHGMDGLAPPLVDSEWVTGSEQRLTRILMHGLSGPIQVKGRTYNLDMPGFHFFSDEQLAALITYIRREWDHRADPVSQETIQSIRKATSQRNEPWRQQELLNIP